MTTEKREPRLATREFWRIVRTIPASVDDFKSYKALGKVLFDPTDSEAVEISSGISVYATEVQARSAAKMASFRGWAGLARLECVKGYVPLLWRSP
jgi:hypothetical protein